MWPGDLVSPTEDWTSAQEDKKASLGSSVGVNNLSFVSEVLGGVPHVNISYLTDDAANVSITKFRHISVM